MSRTVAELLAAMDSRELAEWQAFAQLEPFGEVRDDLRAGVVASTVANVNRGKGGKAFQPSDFLLYREPQTTDDHVKILKMWAL